MTRCRSGDIAIIIGQPADQPLWHFLIGRIVTVTVCRQHRSKANVLVWECAEGEFKSQCGGYTATGIEDYYLMPIRDPGPDAVDEVLQRIPSPMKEKEAA